MGERVHFSLRSSENFCSFPCRTVRFQQSFFPLAIDLWNQLSVDISNSISLPIFKAKLKLVFCPVKYNNLFDFSLSRRASILLACGSSRILCARIAPQKELLWGGGGGGGGIRAQRTRLLPQATILHTRLRLGFHALNEYLFRINCCLSPKCDCGMENETISHYFLHFK